jgi:DNA repair protein RecO (recombination protein O)
MPQRESEAIILRSYSLGEADRLVSFFSRALGRMRGVAAGARRPKSRYGASLEMLSHVRIWWHERETRDLVRITQCELQESFLGAQSDYECGLALAAMSEVSETLLPEREASDPAFRLLLLTARAIERSRKAAVPLTYFCLWTVKLGGWMPEISKCKKCGRELTAGAFASAARPGMLCGNCRLPGFRVLSGSSLLLARRMLQEKLEVLSEMARPEDCVGLRTFLLDVIEHHAERKLNTRRMLEGAS